jgi:hypothetical protein
MHSQNVPAKAKLLNLHSKALKWAFEIMATRGSDGKRRLGTGARRPYPRNTPGFSKFQEAGWCNPLRFRSKQLIAVDSGAETGVRWFAAAASPVQPQRRPPLAAGRRRACNDIDANVDATGCRTKLSIGRGIEGGVQCYWIRRSHNVLATRRSR